MTREPDLDALAEAIEEAQADRSWLARLARRVLAKAAGPAVCSVAICILLSLAHVNLGWVLRVMFYGSPFLAVAVASFVAHAWRQNVGTAYVAKPGQVDLATEPGQVGQVDQGSRVDVGQAARPATVTVTVLPSPPAALPHAIGQASPIPYPDEEETR